jgi:4,5-dihydroxyphthalate decarboxylase
LSDLHLSFAMTPDDRVLPLITGEVKPAGITLEYQGMPGAVPGVFYDQIKFQRYDLSEMSFSSFLIARAKGFPYRILPVFHNRNFSYTRIVIRKSSGIRVDHPEDIAGKRFAVGDYQQTAALWIRGVLEHEFGVHPKDVEWVQTRGERYSHTGASGTRPPVRLTFARKPESALFLDGEIDASMGWGSTGGDSVHALAREGVDLRDNPDFTLLFSDPKAEGIRYFQKTGMFQPHHTTAIRESIVREHPWVAVSLMNAFEESKAIAIRRMRNQTLFAFTEHYMNEVQDVMGRDPWAYGVGPNIKSIDFIQQMSVEQGLTPKQQPLDEIFPEEVLLSEERFDSTNA